MAEQFQFQFQWFGFSILLIHASVELIMFALFRFAAQKLQQRRCEYEFEHWNSHACYNFQTSLTTWKMFVRILHKFKVICTGGAQICLHYAQSTHIDTDILITFLPF